MLTLRVPFRGAYAVVHLAVHQDSGRQRACKVIKKTLIAKKDLYDKVELEIRVLTHLKHVSPRFYGRQPGPSVLNHLLAKHFELCGRLYRCGASVPDARAVSVVLPLSQATETLQQIQFVPTAAPAEICTHMSPGNRSFPAARHCLFRIS